MNNRKESGFHTMTYNSELYQQVILEHNKNPKNFRELPNATHQCEGRHPLCGDRVTVYLNLNDSGVVQDVSFTGSGCAISKSSASLMTEYVKGKTVDEIQVAFDEFHKMVLGELDPSTEKHHLGKLVLFEGVKEYSARVKCATLGWHALSGAINKRVEVTTSKVAASSGEKNLVSQTLEHEETVSLDPNREELDLSGVKCPINFVKVKVKLSKMEVGTQLDVVLDNGDPIKNVPVSVSMEGHSILHTEPVGENQQRIVIKKA